MADFDPTAKRETLILREVGTDAKTNKPIYREEKYRFVSYDGGVDRYIEPVSNYRFASEQIVNPDFNTIDNVGRIDGVEIYQGAPLGGMHQFD